MLALQVRCPAEPCVAAARAEPARRVRAARAVEVEEEAVMLTLAPRARAGARLVVEVTAVDESGNASRVRRRLTLLR